MGMLVSWTLSLLLGLAEQEGPSVQDSGKRAIRQVELDYALRERNAAPLEQFRGGAGGDPGAGLTLVGLLGILGAGLDAGSEPGGLLGLEAALVVAYFALRPRSSRASA